MKNDLINAYHKIITRSFRTVQWLLRAETLGVRVLVINGDGEILLVKHTYMAEWHFPGGGVLSGEPARIAAMRELREETGVVVLEDIELFGIYFHRVMRANDYVALYVVKQFREAEKLACGEIAEVKWFTLDCLPPDLSESTRTRIAEYFYRQPRRDAW